MSRLPVDADAIRALAEILADTGLTEIEIAQNDSRIRVVRAPAPLVQSYAGAPLPLAMPMPGLPAAPAAAATAAGASGAGAPGIGATGGEPDFSKHPGAVTSPMVGVVYLSPEPNAAPFVSEGGTVAAGQTLMLIEAMKTFNQIKAPRAGTLTRLLVSSGAPVEFGEALAVIE